MNEKQTRRVTIVYKPTEYTEVKRRADLLGLAVGAYLKLAERFVRLDDIKNALSG